MSERQGEKEEEGRGWEGRWRHDRGGALMWAAVLIWGGLVLLAETTGFAANYSWWRAWPVFFIGWGLIISIGVGVSALMTGSRRRAGGGLIFGLVLIGIGFGLLFGWSYVWPLVLIAVGVIILLRSLVGRH